MKRYEIVAIVKADLADDDLAAIIERSQAIITDRKGVIAKVEKWGKRRLAYEIKKQKDGFYFLIDFAGDGPIVAEIERNFKIDDRILKFMTVKKEGAVTAEGMENETAAAESKRTQGRSEATSAGNSIAQPGDKTAGEATTRRFAPKKIYNREEQPARGE
ncbi:MAG: 30S ribosomal protein S6 [Smithella sp.]